MRIIVLFFIIFVDSFFANVNIAYDRNSIKLEQILSKTVFNISNISLKPALNQSKALYKIKHLDDVVMATTHSVTVNALHSKNPDKVNKYTLISTLEKQDIHIVVRKNSKYRTIYDLKARNVNVGIEGNAMDFFTMTLSSALNLNFNNQYYKKEDALSNMLQAGGIDAVIFSDKVPSKLLSKYKNLIRLISIPSIKGLKQTIIAKDIYTQETDSMSVESDMLLVGTNNYINSNPAAINKIVDNIFINKNINKSEICNKNYVIKGLKYQVSKCNNFIKLKNTDKPKKNIVVYNLVKKISSLEDIEIYTYALVNNKIFGGLSKKTELKKIDKLMEYYKEENGSKIIIKSYSNNSSAYKGGQKIFKLLKKRGVKRGDMIIKSFNTKKRCDSDKDIDCKYVHTKVKFEFL